MPRLWNETIEAHRRDVRDAILDTTASLIEEHGLLSVTMSRIAEETGIGRATLYKYFPDVEAILNSWHQRQIDLHFGLLEEVRDSADGPAERLEAVLDAYALIAQKSRVHSDSELAAFFHRDHHSAHEHSHHKLRDMVRALIVECVQAGGIRDDIPPDELANYCVHSLESAGNLHSWEAVRRLVTLTLDALRRPTPSPGGSLS